MFLQFIELFVSEQDSEQSSDSDDDDEEELGETDGEEDDIDSGPENPWEILIDNTYVIHQEEFEDLVKDSSADGNDEAEIRLKAFKCLLPTLRDTLRHELFKFHMMMKRMKKDKVYKMIVDTMKSLEADDYLPEEAALAAIEKRSYLTNRMIRKIPEEWNAEEEEEEEEEPPSKRIRYI